MTLRKKAYYSIIQYLPDASRQEAVNVGLILYAPPNRCVVKTTEDMSRVKRFFPTVDTRFLRMSVDAVVTRLEEESAEWWQSDNLTRFAARLANDVQIVAPRPMAYSGTLEKELERLFEDLVA